MYIIDRGPFPVVGRTVTLLGSRDRGRCIGGRACRRLGCGWLDLPRRPDEAHGVRRAPRGCGWGRGGPRTGRDTARDHQQARAGATAAVGARPLWPYSLGRLPWRRPWPWSALRPSWLDAAAGRPTRQIRPRCHRGPQLIGAGWVGPGVTDGAESWPGVVPLQTLADFYVTDVHIRVPLVDVDAWRLSMGVLSRARCSCSMAYLLGVGHIGLRRLPGVHPQPARVVPPGQPALDRRAGREGSSGS